MAGVVDQGEYLRAAAQLGRSVGQLFDRIDQQLRVVVECGLPRPTSLALSAIRTDIQRVRKALQPLLDGAEIVALDALAIKERVTAEIGDEQHG